jgi:thymidylate synthase (FAD)
LKAELLDYMGNDLMAVNVARVSYGKWSTELNHKDIRLLEYLFEHKHISPWRHPVLQWRIEVPIFVERQLFKHQVGLSANCLHGDTEITFLKASGGLNKIKIKDLYFKYNNGRLNQNTEKDKFYSQKRIKNMKCRVLNEETGEFTISNIENIFFSGIKKMYKISLQDGKEIICTDKHKILTDTGWKTLSDGITTASFIATNGVRYVGNGNYQDYNVLLNWKNNGLTIKEMAKIANCSYHTIRKWLKKHSLQFDKTLTQFKKNHTPWNKNKNGYFLKFTEDGYKRKKESAKKQPKGHLSKAWRGGTTNERAKIGQWTRSVSKEIYEKYKYTCQKCGNGGDLNAHHIIPVSTDINYAYDINNLVCICKKCHYDIHKSKESEKEFALKFYNESEIKEKEFGKNLKNRKSNKLKVKYIKINKIEYFGEDETYDIEMKAPYHNFVANGIVVHNSISGRYVDFSESFWKLDKLRKQSVNSKQGSSDEILDDPELIKEWYNVIDVSQAAYKKMVSKGVAKELARTILPLALNTTFIWTGSLLAFLHLFNLRLKSDAQEETRIIVSSMLEQTKQLKRFEHTLRIWGF